MAHTHQPIDQQSLRFLYNITRPACRPCQDIWGDERMSVNKTRTACENSTMSFEELHDMLPKAFEQYLKQDRYALQPISPHLQYISHCVHLRHSCIIVCATCMHTHIRESASWCEVLWQDRLSVPTSMEDIQGEDYEDVTRYAAQHTRCHINADRYHIAIQQITLHAITCS